MKSLLFCIVITLVLPFCVKAATPLNLQELGFARGYAKDFLEARGASPGRIELKVEEYTDFLVFFNDMRNHLFLLMVRDEYSSLVKESVLAFSIGTPHSKVRDMETFMLMIKFYDNLIKQMYEGVLPKEQSTGVEHLRIMPMLNHIRWRQFGLRDIFEEQHGSVLSGCGAVAVGQLMAYYCWPDTVRYDFSYVDSQRRQRSMKMDGTPIDWKSMKNIYFYHDKDSDSLAPLMTMAGMAIMSDYGKTVTNSYSSHMKRALTTHFRYSPEMFYVSRDVVSENTMLRLICKDLSAGHPCILSGGRHHFICDGVFDGFLHLNMGWSGSYDGWYRFPITKSDAINHKAFIETVLLNIVPMKALGKDTTVTLSKAGTLAKSFTATDYATVSKLKVSGPINGDDIRLLRRMAGYVEPQDYFSWKGRLTELDLSDAEIVKDSVPYYEQEAYLTDGNLIAKDGSFVFSATTDSYWRSFKENGLQNQSFYTTEVIQDSVYIIHMKTKNGIISRNMFDGCTNLQYIHLPNNTTLIELHAFRLCINLREITIPPTVSQVRNPCSECRSLQHIYVCKDAPYLEVLKRDVDYWRKRTSPTLTIDIAPEMKLYVDVTAKRKQVSSGNNVANKYNDYPTKFISRYKIVNGKKVLIKRIPIK